jgi:hypothetical protein
MWSAQDYVAFMQLGLRWTNSYAANAEPWINAFQSISGRSEITDWMLQSTDPDHVYFSGKPAVGLPGLQRSDGTVRPDYEGTLLNGTARNEQSYYQYIRPATMRSFKHMQVQPCITLSSCIWLQYKNTGNCDGSAGEVRRMCFNFWKGGCEKTHMYLAGWHEVTNHHKEAEIIV